MDVAPYRLATGALSTGAAAKLLLLGLTLWQKLREATDGAANTASEEAMV